MTGPLVFCLHLCSVSGPCSGSAPRRPFPRSLALTGCRVQSLCARQCACCQHVFGTRTDQTGPFFPGRFVNGVDIMRSCRNQEPLLPTGRIMTSLAHRSPWCLVSSAPFLKKIPVSSPLPRRIKRATLCQRKQAAGRNVSFSQPGRVVGLTGPLSVFRGCTTSVQCASLEGLSRRYEPDGADETKSDNVVRPVCCTVTSRDNHTAGA